MPNAPRLSCVIVAFHRPERLAGLVASLADPAVEVVVVNVDDDPAVTSAVASASAAAQVVSLVGNPGYAAAVNAGVAATTAAVVAFMNDDLEVSLDSLDLLAADVERGDADVAVPRVIDASGRVEPTVAALPTPGALAVEWALLPDRPVRALARCRVQKWRTPVVPEAIDAASAMLVVTRRDVLVTQPLPEAYFLYWEESEWFWHLRRRGLRVLLDPRATCCHRGGRDDVRPEKSRLLARNAVRCIRRTQGAGAAAVAYAVVVLWNVRLVAVAAIRRGVRRNGGELLRARWAGLTAAVAAVGEIVGAR